MSCSAWSGARPSFELWCSCCARCRPTCGLSSVSHCTPPSQRLHLPAARRPGPPGRRAVQQHERADQHVRPAGRHRRRRAAAEPPGSAQGLLLLPDTPPAGGGGGEQGRAGWGGQGAFHCPPLNGQLARLAPRSWRLRLLCGTLARAGAPGRVSGHTRRPRRRRAPATAPGESGTLPLFDAPAALLTLLHLTLPTRPAREARRPRLVTGAGTGRAVGGSGSHARCFLSCPSTWAACSGGGL